MKKEPAKCKSGLPILSKSIQETIPCKAVYGYNIKFGKNNRLVAVIDGGGALKTLSVQILQVPRY